MENFIEANAKQINAFEKKLAKTNIKLEKLSQVKKKNYLHEYKESKLLENKELLEHYIEYYKNNDKDNAKIKKAIAKEKYRRHQILHGNITQTVLMICLPLAIYGFFNGFYSLIDAMMASYISDKSVSNVAVINQVKSMISAFGAGLAGGGGVLVSRYYGSGKIEDAKKSASNMFFVSCIMSGIIVLLLIPLANIILRIAHVPEITNDVTLYFRLILIELVLVAINNIFVGLEKIKGNSKKIFVLNITVLFIKLLFNVLFIFGFKVKSIIFLEIATIAGQSFLFLFGMSILFSKKNMLKLSIKYMRPESQYVIPIFKLSVPIFLGKFVMSLGKATVNALCGQYYSTATDGLITGALGVSNNLSGLVTNTTNVFEEGESTIVSQNIGNKNLKRTIKTFYKTLLIVAIISAIGFVLVRFIFLNQLTSLFSANKASSTQDGGKALSDYIKEIFVYDSLSIPALGLTAALLGLLYGYGKTFLSTILNFSRIGIRILSLIICHAVGMDYTAAGVSMGVSNILIGLMALGFLLIFMHRLKKNGYQGMYITDPEPTELPIDYNN